MESLFTELTPTALSCHIASVCDQLSAGRAFNTGVRTSSKHIGGLSPTKFSCDCSSALSPRVPAKAYTAIAIGRFTHV